ncbi:MAG: hypothetical protein JW885_01805 [Deltaproteobacteria bacterium]|nr:hypothetical protein [Candidatus Zymogenaceae bacterium]
MTEEKRDTGNTTVKKEETGKETADKKTTAKNQSRGGKPEATVRFEGTLTSAYGNTALFLLTALFLFVPLPLAYAAARRWFFRSLVVESKEAEVSVQYTGKGLPLMKYWPLVLPLVLGLCFAVLMLVFDYRGVDWWYVGLAVGVGIFTAPFGWVRKRKYVMEHTEITIDGKTVVLGFVGSSGALLKHMFLCILSLVPLSIPLPWAMASALRWYIGSHTVEYDAETYKPVFSGPGKGLLGWYLGLLVSPCILFLPMGPVIRGLVRWLERYVNVIGLEKSIEFEFGGENGPVFGAVFLEVFVAAVAVITGLILAEITGSGAVIGAVVLFLCVLAFQPLILWIVAKWLVSGTEIQVR